MVSDIQVLDEHDHSIYTLKGQAMSTEAACLVRLQRVEPLIASLPNVLYDFTFPQLSERTMMLLQGNKMQHDQPYRGYRFAHRSTEPHDDRPLRAFEAAQFISVVYGSSLAPLRCGAAESGRNVKKHFIDSFVRTLCHPKVLNALETVAHDIEAMRGLDEFQSGAGSTAVHWLNYLATEALNGSSILLWGALPWNDAGRVRRALCTIRDSASARDRFLALARGAL